MEDAKKKKELPPIEIKKPGALRKALKIKVGEKIPLSVLKKAAKLPGKTGQRARFAINVLKIGQKKKK